MGGSVSTCACCFPLHRSPFPRALETDSLSKYQPTSMPSDISTASLDETPSPSPYSCLLAGIHEKAEQFVRIVTEPVAGDLELVMQQERCAVYTKNTADGFVIRSEWWTRFAPKQYLDFLGNLEKRKTWDRNVEDMHLVEQLEPQVKVFYQAYKSFFMIAARDLVLACKKFPLERAWIDTCSSIDFPACPLKPGFVRAHVTLGGYYVEALEQPEGDYQSRVVSYTEGSFGGALPRSLVKKLSTINVPHFVKAVDEALEAHLKEEADKGLVQTDLALDSS